MSGRPAYRYAPVLYKIKSALVLCKNPGLSELGNQHALTVETVGEGGHETVQSAYLVELQ